MKVHANPYSLINFKTRNWSTQGCKLIQTDKSETICECDHLTAFALLMDMHQFVVSKNQI